MSTLRFILVTASLTVVVGACDYWFVDDDRVCTLMGCSSGFSLHLSPSSIRFQPGRFDVSVEVENDTTRSCFFVVSNDPERCASGQCVVEENCNALYFVGYSDPDRVMIAYPVLPGMLTIQVQHDGSDIGELSVEPEYRMSQPNGPGCPPICRRASASLFLDQG